MGGCVAKEQEGGCNDPVIVMKKQRKIPSLSSIAENHLYKVRVEKERRNNLHRETHQLHPVRLR